MTEVQEGALLLLFVRRDEHAAVGHAEEICSLMKDDCLLEIVDVENDADIAEAAGVLTTPTIVRLRPEPRRQVVGNLTHVEAIAAYLSSP